MSEKLYKVSIVVFVSAENEQEALEFGKIDLKEAIEGKHPSAYIEVEEYEKDFEDEQSLSTIG